MGLQAKLAEMRDREGHIRDRMALKNERDHYDSKCVRIQESVVKAKHEQLSRVSSVETSWTISCRSTTAS